MTKVIVVGGGFIGIAAAYYLSEAGVSVKVLEKGEIASEASYANGGLVVPSRCLPLASPSALSWMVRMCLGRKGPVRLNPFASPDTLAFIAGFVKACNIGKEKYLRLAKSLVELGKLSLRMFEDLAKSGGPDLEFERRGLLEVYLTEKGMLNAVKEAEGLKGLGIDLRPLDPERTCQLEPSIARNKVRGGVYDPDCAQLNPRSFSAFLASSIVRHGGEVVKHVKVTGFKVKGARIEAANTDRGPYRCDAIVMAAGPWSPLLLRQLGLNIPAQPAKGYMLMLSPFERRPSVPLCIAEDQVYLTPHPDGRVRSVAAFELVGLDRAIDRRRIAWVMSRIRSAIPSASEARVVEVKCGFRPCVADGLPIIGKVPGYDNLFVATGHCRLGITLAPVTGKLVSEILLGQRPSVTIDGLSPARFIKRRQDSLI